MKTFACVCLVMCALTGGALAKGGVSASATLSSTQSTKTGTGFGDLNTVDTLRWLP